MQLHVRVAADGYPGPEITVERTTEVDCASPGWPRIVVERVEFDAREEARLLLAELARQLPFDRPGFVPLAEAIPQVGAAPISQGARG